MTLFEKIEKIQYEKKLGVNDFLELTGFSKGLYYDIKSGKKTELKPLQAKIIHDVFPEFSSEWLLNKLNKDINITISEINDYSNNEVFLEKEGVRFELIELVDHFIKNKDAYLEQSEYLQLYLNKHIELGVKARLEELGYTVKWVKK